MSRITSEWAFIGKYWVGDGQDSQTYRGCIRVTRVMDHYQWEFLRAIPIHQEGDPNREVTTGVHESRWSLLGLSGPGKPAPNWDEGKFKTIYDAVKDAEKVLSKVFGGPPEKSLDPNYWHPLLMQEIDVEW